ncbi:hypothetical protein JZU68_04750, partial [bacterium]|nr:hypothetical protein [bacterium]
IQQSLPLDPAGISGAITLRLQKLGEATGYEINDGYFFTKDKKNLVLFIEPANPVNETGKNAVLIKAIEDFASELKKQEQFKNIECGFMGATAVSVGNAHQIQRDTALKENTNPDFPSDYFWDGICFGLYFIYREGYFTHCHRCNISITWNCCQLSLTHLNSPASRERSP